MTMATVRHRCVSWTSCSRNQSRSVSAANMRWKFHEAQRKCRAVLAVSKQGHCLNSMLHRWSTGTLPIEVVAVVSNHQDMRSLREWHGVPVPLLAGA